ARPADGAGLRGALGDRPDRRPWVWFGDRRGDRRRQADRSARGPVARSGLHRQGDGRAVRPGPPRTFPRRRAGRLLAYRWGTGVVRLPRRPLSMPWVLSCGAHGFFAFGSIPVNAPGQLPRLEELHGGLPGQLTRERLGRRELQIDPADALEDLLR